MNVGNKGHKSATNEEPAEPSAPFGDELQPPSGVAAGRPSVEQPQCPRESGPDGAARGERTLGDEPAPESGLASPCNHPVVGIGASAGGLEALEEFFAHTPRDSGLSFVVVQHLSPDFKSLMDELLARRTRIPVYRVEDDMLLEPNAIYVIPPGKELRLAGGRLRLTDKARGATLTMPIDVFLESLAEEMGELATAVVLSGTGSDGSRGVRAVHDRGGTVLVQTPESAKFDGMPRNALDTGVVDLMGTPAELPQLVLRMVRRIEEPLSQTEPSPPHGLPAVLELLRQEHGIDFSHYKPSTIKRRIERRLVLKRFKDIDEYYAHLLEHPKEVQLLYWDLLIGVTRFFRDAAAFDYVEHHVVPELIARADPQEGLRVWVAGCATGEEAYSLAILFREYLDNSGQSLRVKIFATDAHRTSLEKAAAGRYSMDSIAGLDPERVRRHFRKVGDEFQVVSELRNMVVFAAHDVLNDAPFTKLDLVTCRNLLIYLHPNAQERALSVMLFGLKTGGVLFLGPSESTGQLEPSFEPLNRHWKIYRKRRDTPLASGLHLTAPAMRAPATRRTKAPPQETRIQRAQQALIRKHAPPSFLVNGDLQVIHTFSGGGEYLGHRDGKPTLNVLDLVGPELKLTLNAALQRAQKTRATVSYSSVRTDSGPKLDLMVEPVPDPDGTCFLICIQEQKVEPREYVDDQANLPKISRERIADLEEELQYTKENLQATLEEMETANEELQAANEELVAANEELQSTNEELHSVNEELYTVNAEHQRKIDQLTELTEDMENLFAATDVGTVFLDRTLRVRRFTPRIAELFQLLPQDIGRPIGSFAHSLMIPELIEDLTRVLASEGEYERQVADRTGRWYLVRVVPYRVGKLVDGLVMSVVDITTLKETEARLRLMSKVFKDVADPVIIENLQGEIIDLNPEAERAYGWSRSELLGKSGLILVPEELQSQAVRLREECQRNEYVRNAEMVRRSKNGHTHPALVTLSRIATQEGAPPVIAIISKDITLRKEAEQAAREAVRKRDEFLAMLSHELRNPMSVIQNATQVTTGDDVDEATLKRCHSVILRQVKHMASLLGDLLDVSRVTQGKVELHRQRILLQDTVKEAVEAVDAAVKGRKQQLQVAIDEAPIVILGDKARLRQIHENLLTNASKYTPDGGRISLSVTHDADAAVIRVQDTGRGIPSDRLDSIFELFTQCDAQLDRSDGGMGVGLTLVRALVQLHGGTVVALSDGAELGSTFEVRLPLAGDETADERPGAATEGENVQQCHDILIIEDNADARETLKLMLELDGHQVRVAADGEAGLEAILSNCPHVAFVDIGLPKVDGYAIAKAVRTRCKNPSVRLIALTGYGRAEDRAAIKEAGFDAHLVKPVSREELRRALTVPSTTERSATVASAPERSVAAPSATAADS